MMYQTMLLASRLAFFPNFLFFAPIQHIYLMVYMWGKECYFINAITRHNVDMSGVTVSQSVCWIVVLVFTNFCPIMQNIDKIYIFLFKPNAPVGWQSKCVPDSQSREFVLYSKQNKTNKPSNITTSISRVFVCPPCIWCMALCWIAVWARYLSSRFIYRRVSTTNRPKQVQASDWN